MLTPRRRRRAARARRRLKRSSNRKLNSANPYTKAMTTHTTPHSGTSGRVHFTRSSVSSGCSLPYRAAAQSHPKLAQTARPRPPVSPTAAGSPTRNATGIWSGLKSGACMRSAIRTCLLLSVSSWVRRGVWWTGSAQTADAAARRRRVASWGHPPEKTATSPPAKETTRGAVPEKPGCRPSWRSKLGRRLYI